MLVNGSRMLCQHTECFFLKFNTFRLLFVADPRGMGGGEGVQIINSNL